MNGQGIRRKVHEIRENLQNMDLDVMGIAETWLLPGEKIDVDGYKWIGFQERVARAAWRRGVIVAMVIKWRPYVQKWCSP